MATIRKKKTSALSSVTASAAQRALAAAKAAAAKNSSSSTVGQKSSDQMKSTTYRTPSAGSSTTNRVSRTGSSAAKTAINSSAQRSAQATQGVKNIASNPAATQQILNKTAAATGGATTPATTGATPTTASGTAKTAFGKRFSPDTIGMVTSNPAALIQSYYDFMGQDPYTGEMALSMEQNADSMRNLFTLFGPKSGDPTGQGQDAFSYADWAGQYLDNANNVGGKYYAPQDVVNRLMTQNENDTVFSHLYAGTAPDVSAYRFNQSYENALAPYMVPEAFSANMSWLNQQQNEFVADKAAGKLKDMNFAEYLKSKGFD